MRILRRSNQARFEDLVIRGKEGECWRWDGHIADSGHGRFSWHDGDHRMCTGAHRAAWMLYKGEIPAGQFVLHKCDNASCVNPAHLMLGDNNENMR